MQGFLKVNSTWLPLHHLGSLEKQAQSAGGRGAELVCFTIILPRFSCCQLADGLQHD